MEFGHGLSRGVVSLSPSGLRILKNLGWLTFGEGLLVLSKFILVILAARILGAKGFGTFSFSLAFVSLFIFVAEMGTSTITTRELSHNREKEADFNAIFTLKILLGAVSFLMIFLISFFISKDPEIRQIIYILGIYIIVDNFPEIIFAFLRAREKMIYEGLTKAFRGIVIALFSLMILHLCPSPINLGWAYLFSDLLVLLILLFLFNIRIGFIRLRVDVKVWKEILYPSIPLGLSALTIALFLHTDSVMLGYWGFLKENGWYSAAYKLITPLFILLNLIAQSFFPQLVRGFHSKKEDFSRVWEALVGLMVMVSIPFSILSLSFARHILKLLYTDEYLAGTNSFKLIALMAAITIVRDPFYRLLICANRQANILFITAAIAVLNIGINYILIPVMRHDGAAIASLISQTVGFVIFIYYAGRFSHYPLFGRRVMIGLIAASFAGSSMAITLHFSTSIISSFVFSIFSYIMVYILVVLATKRMFLK